MSRKPRVRVQQDGSVITMDGGRAYTRDSFDNFLTRTGINAGNVSTGGTYGFNPVSRLRLKMEWAYRGSWVVGTIVDCVAEDMTREGVTVECDAKPEDIAQFEEQQIDRLQVWNALCDTAKWGRLYGGSGGFIMIDGQDPATPLDAESVGKDQFRGVMPLDRWSLFPTLNDLVADYGPDMGLPKFYDVRPDYGTGLPEMRIHYSRLVRMEGVRLPYWQRIAENMWGQSVVERLWDRLIAFDSATQGAAQLVYKAHLRTYSVKGLRKIIGEGGKALDALLKQLDLTRKYQSNEGMTLVDAEDKFEVHSYGFEGLDDVLLQFGQQLSGASQIPLVRLFGQSPAGLNSTGDSDLRTYYDNVRRQQVSLLGQRVRLIYHCAWRSQHGEDPPEGWKVPFKTLWQMDDVERAEVASKLTETTLAPYREGLTPESVALKGLKNNARVTGVFSEITDEMIQSAEEEDHGEVPEPEQLGVGPDGQPLAGVTPGRAGDPRQPQKPGAGGGAPGRAPLRLVAKGAGE